MGISNLVVKVYDALAEKYNELIEVKPHNAFYDRPNTLSLLDDIRGKRILDVACGPGKYAEILLDQGAEVVGIDISEAMISFAKERNGSRGTFFVYDVSKPLDVFHDQSFDVVLCALGMDYLEDWNGPVLEFSRLLKPNGVLVLSITHPFFDYTFFKAKNYFIKELTYCTWRGFGKAVEMPSYRRSLQDCLQPITENGFYIDRVLEPKPVPEFEKYDARHYKELNKFPSFLCIKAIKRS